MKGVIFTSLCVILSYTTKANADACGSSVAGPILQQVTKRIDYVDGLVWTGNRSLYVDRYNPHVCEFQSNGSNYCNKLEGLMDISSVYTIKNNPDQLIIFADRKVIQVNSDIKRGNIIQQSKMKTLTTINSNPMSELKQSITDNKGRTIIGENTKRLDGKTEAKVYIINDDYVSKVIIPENNIIEVSGIVLSSDYKFLFVADCKRNVVHKYAYDDRKGTVGKHEIVFNKTEHMFVRGDISTLGITKNNELWISMGGTGMIMLYNYNTKQILQHIKVPASYPTSISYGGPKLEILFIGTTIKNGEYTMLEPGAGAIYAVSGTGTVGFEQTMLTLQTKNKKGKHA